MLDLTHVYRMLRRRPGFTAAIVGTLALGIGLTVTMVAVVRGVLLAPLPFAAPESLVRLHQVYPERGVDRGAFSALDGEDWAASSSTLESLGLFSQLDLGLVVLGEGEPYEARTSYVTAEFFTTLGVPAMLGRTIRADEVRDETRVVVLAHDFWQRRFGGDATVVGTTIDLDASPHLVVGVMPPTFRYPSSQFELYAPVTLIPPASIPRERHVRWLQAVGRLAPGVTTDQAQRELTTIAAALDREYAGTGASAAAVVRLDESVAGAVRPALLVLLAGVAVVLMIACVNVANLLLAHGANRRRELAVRAALGAGRRRLIGQLIAECAVLVALGSTLGVALASWGIDLVATLAEQWLPRAAEVRVDGEVLAATVGITALVTLLTGLIPALRASRPVLHDVLGDGSRGNVASQSRLRRVLVAGEVALATLLVLGAVLLFRSVVALLEVDTGFRTEGLLTASLTVGEYQAEEQTSFLEIHDAMLERIEALPGVTSVASIRQVPIGVSGVWVPFPTVAEATTPSDERPSLQLYQASPGVLRTLGVTLHAGRDIEARDDADSEPVIVINETLAQTAFGVANPTGEQLVLGGGLPVRVVGVAADVAHAGLDQPVGPVAYIALRQNSRRAFTFLIRGDVPPETLVGPVRDAIRTVAPDQAIRRIAPMIDLVREEVGQPRFFASLLGLFAIAAVILAAIGIYGVITLLVGERRREIGVRIALGADHRDVIRLVLGQGLSIGGIGIAIGLLGSLAAVHLLESLLFGVQPRDPLTFLVVAGMLTLVTLFAAWLPAHRATRVDPADTLRA
ncbi:MAG: ABC transporter permease [Acidobacteriota bacterium]